MKKAEARTLAAVERERERESYNLINEINGIKNALLSIYARDVK